MENRQIAERGEIGVLLYVIEVVPAGGDGFFQTGERQVEVFLLLGFFGVGGLRFVFHEGAAVSPRKANQFAELCIA